MESRSTLLRNVHMLEAHGFGRGQSETLAEWARAVYQPAFDEGYWEYRFEEAGFDPVQIRSLFAMTNEKRSAAGLS